MPSFEGEVSAFGEGATIGQAYKFSLRVALDFARFVIKPEHDVGSFLNCSCQAL